MSLETEPHGAEYSMRRKDHALNVVPLPLQNCRVCGDCGSRTPGSGPSSRWHLNYSVCDSCYQQRNKGLCCPLCSKAYRHFTQKQMAQCNTCKKQVSLLKVTFPGRFPCLILGVPLRFVHAECDSLDLSRGTLPDYICPVCKNPSSTEVGLISPYLLLG